MLTLLPILLLLSQSGQSGQSGPWAALHQPTPAWWMQLHQRYLPEQFRGAFPLPPPNSSTVSFTPQGSLPWLPSNVSTDYLIICAPAGTSLPAGTIYQLATDNGIAPLSPMIAKSLLYRRKAMNKWTLLLDAGTAGSLAIPVLGQSGVIAMSSKWVVTLLGSHAVLDYATTQVSARIPDPGPTIDMLLDPNAILSFNGSCVEATMAVSTAKGASLTGTPGTKRGLRRPIRGTFTIK